VLNEKNAFAMDSEPAYWRLVCPRWLLPMHHECRLAEAAARRQSAASVRTRLMRSGLMDNFAGCRARVVNGWLFLVRRGGTGNDRLIDSGVSARRIILVAAVLAGGLCVAQFRPRPGLDPRSGLPGNFVRIEGGLVVNEDELRTARETDTHSSGTPNWT